MTKFITSKIKNFWKKEENKLIGGLLFAESSNHQILLFEN